MKKAYYGVALISSLVLTACGGGSGPEEPKIPGVPGGGVKLTAPIFAPGDGELPLPNDLLFNGTEDLTLNIPNADPTNMADPQNAISGLDGWSTHAPFTIGFRAAIDGSTLALGDNLRVFKVSTYRPEAIPGTGIPAPTGPVTGIESELVPGVDYVAQQASPTNIMVIPLRPLEAQTGYMVVMTNGIMDANGVAITSDPQFTIAKRAEPIPAGGPTSALEPVRQLVNAMLAQTTAEGIDSDDVVLAYQFMTVSVADALQTAKLAYVDAPFANPAYVPASSFNPTGMDTTPITGIGAADIYVGQTNVPYLLTAPTASNPTSILSNFWVGADMVPAGGMMVPNPLAGANLSYANKLPQLTGVESVPLLVTVPKNPACAKPYPVMIFQHGITGNRTNMFGMADSMAGSCMAVVAMDLPLHGVDSSSPFFTGYTAGGTRERTFGVDFQNNATGAIPMPDGIPDASGAHIINLGNLLVSRDNLRQAALDLLALEKAIPYMDIDGDMMPDFDATKISFMGHSLGGIVGSVYTANSDLAKQSIIATASGSIVEMLDNSVSYQPVIRGGLSASTGVPVDNAAFIPEVLAPFKFAAQTVIDAGDPINYGAMAQANGVPTLSIQIKNDSVVPNAAATAPLVGSIPHAAVYGLPVITETTATDRAFLKYVNGDHGSPVSPAAHAPTTVSIQTAIISFIASGGTQVLVNDPTLVEQ